jgi:hypothetical protein
MVEFAFRRSFPWIQRAIDPVVPVRGPSFFADSLIATFDIFGTQKIDDQRFEQVPGGVDQVEVFHDAVPADRIRLYSAVELTHDDGAANRWIRIGQIISPGPGSFSFVGFTSAALRPAAVSPEQGEGAIAMRSMWVGPGNRIAGRVNLLTVGAQITLRLVWTELVLGEAVRFT